MLIMKQLILPLLLLLFLSACTATRIDYGPNQEYSGREWAEKQTEWMENYLKPSRDQRRRLKDLNWEYVRRLDREFRQADTQFERIQVVRRIDFEKDQELRQILTVDQYEMYMDNKADLYELYRQN